MSLSRDYNLGRLGNAGDEVRIEADEAERATIASLGQALSLPHFGATVTLAKTGATRFRLTYRLEAEVIQACVVTLEPVSSRIERNFERELHFLGTGRRPQETAPELVLDEGEEVEEIESLHYDLAVPMLEEFLLALDPYPRRPGVEFDPGEEAKARPESPFAVLKGFKPSK